MILYLQIDVQSNDNQLTLVRSSLTELKSVSDSLPLSKAKLSYISRK